MARTLGPGTHPPAMDPLTVPPAEESLSAHLWPVGFTPSVLEFQVTPELNQQYLYAVEDFHPRYLDGGDAGMGIVHPALLLNMSNTTRSPSFRLDAGVGGIHARDETTFVRTAGVGERLTVRWELVERYSKRDRIYTVTAIEVTDARAEVVLLRRAHITYRFG